MGSSWDIETRLFSEDNHSFDEVLNVCWDFRADNICVFTREETVRIVSRTSRIQERSRTSRIQERSRTSRIQQRPRLSRIRERSPLSRSRELPDTTVIRPLHRRNNELSRHTEVGDFINVAINGTYQGEENDTCTICWENFKMSENIKILSVCLHRYHPACIDRWLNTKRICAICRYAVS